ncbi:MAG: ATP synthase F1 subunit epsilon [Bacilli bacterium]|nr:ATP synthase F1 subunit epsilon [Bacilli bacterium]
MDKSFKVLISTPYGKYLETQAEYLSVTTGMGVLGILANHTPLITNLEICELEIKSGKETLNYAISGGLMNIKPNNEVVLLVNTIERGDEIDLDRAMKSKERAEKRLNEDNVDAARARASLARALVRIAVSNKIKL